MAEPARREEDDVRPPPVRDLPGASTSAGDSVTTIAHESRRYRDDKESRRPPLRIRSWRAYWTTFRVIGSYLWLKLRARFHSDAWVEHTLRAIHLRNARRIERTIIELQGLFIK